MRLTRRGRIVLIYAPLTLAILAALFWIAGNVWYTGDGYCIGSMSKCLGEEFTR